MWGRVKHINHQLKVVCAGNLRPVGLENGLDSGHLQTVKTRIWVMNKIIFSKN